MEELLCVFTRGRKHSWGKPKWGVYNIIYISVACSDAYLWWPSPHQPIGRTDQIEGPKRERLSDEHVRWIPRFVYCSKGAPSLTYAPSRWRRHNEHLHGSSDNAIVRTVWVVCTGLGAGFGKEDVRWWPTQVWYWVRILWKPVLGPHGPWNALKWLELLSLRISSGEGEDEFVQTNLPLPMGLVYICTAWWPSPK